MSATGQGPPIGAAEVYQEFIDAVNRQDLEGAAQFVDAARYRENCVGFTHGFVDWPEAQKSVRQVWKGLPDLRVELDQVLASGDVALCPRHGPRHRNRAALRGASHQALVPGQLLRLRPGRRRTDHRAGPASRRAHPDAASSHGKALGLVGLDAMFLRL